MLAQGPYCSLPSNYYDGLEGLTCNQLKAALYAKISAGHDAQTYASFWANFEKTDKRRNDADSRDIVWDMYTDRPASTGECEFIFVTNQDVGSSGTAECQVFNREHSMPKSWFGGDISPMYTDMFELVPTDKYLNSERGNYPYGEVNSGVAGSKSYSNGTKRGTSAIAGISGIVFEPIDAYKGDFARAYLYMITRYHNVVAGWQSLDANGAIVLDGQQYPGFQIPYLKMLLQWHHNDPVSQKEIDRNNAIYCVQKNRNPFIDHPEYVDLVWNSGCAGAEALPVNLLSFRGMLTGSTVTLGWEVANELNLDRYEIERSVNGRDFAVAGSVLADGSKAYQFKDDVSQLAGRRLYYRLKQTDKNGQFKYSEIFQVHVPLQQVFSILGNPASHRLNIQLNSSLQNGSLQIIDLAGRVQLQKAVSQAAGMLNFDISGLPSGNYFVRITDSKTSQALRLEIIK